MQADGIGAAVEPAHVSSLSSAVRVDLASYAAGWIESYTGRTSRGIDACTREDYARSLRMHVIPRLGDLELNAIAPRDIRALVSAIEELGHAPSSVRKHLAPVKALLATAVEDGLLASNPCSAIRVAGRREDWQPVERRILNTVEIERFFAVCPSEWAVFFELLLHTGVRISEAVGLRWEDVSLDGLSLVRVRRQVRRGRIKAPKTRYGRREIPLSPGMADTLRARRDATAHPRDEDPLFATAAGACLDVSNLRARVLRPTADAAGLERVGFHTFRHTCASLLFAAGKDLKQVQHWLGHHDPAFTLSTYIHLIDGGLGDAAFFDNLTRT